MPTKKKPPYKCGIGDCTFTHTRGQVVGHHRRFVHGISGTSKSAQYDKKKAAQKAAAKGTKKEEANHEIPVEVIAYTIGRIDQLIQTVALENDASPRLVASRVFEHFRASQSW